MFGYSHLAVGASLRKVRFGSNPASLFDKYATTGLYVPNFDPTRLLIPSNIDKQFQDISCRFVAAEATETIGLVVNEAEKAALGPELMPAGDGDGTSIANWVTNDAQALLTLDGGAFKVENGDATQGVAGRQVTAEVGATYRIEFDVLSLNVASTIGVSLSGAVFPGGSSTNFNGGPAGTKRALYVVATATAMRVSFGPNSGSLGAYARFKNVSIRKIAGGVLGQSTTTTRPALALDGTKFVVRCDGVDDNILSTVTPGIATTIIVAFKASAAQCSVIGARAAGGASGRAYIHVDASGFLTGGVGGHNETVIKGAESIVDVKGVAALRYDGTNVYLYWMPFGGAFSLVYSGAQSGAPDTTVAFRLGTINTGGAASGATFNGDIYGVFVAKVALTEREIKSVAGYLANGGPAHKATPAEQFTVYDEIGYTDKPALGLEDNHIIYASELFAGAPNHDNPYQPALVAAAAARADLAQGTPLTLDIEDWNANSVSVGEAAAIVARDKYIQAIEWFREATGQAALGYYALIPLRDYVTPATGGSDAVSLRQWRESNTLLLPLAQKVDVCFPSLYAFDTDAAKWQIYAKWNISEARRIAPGKPIIPYIWPQVWAADLNGAFLSGAFWTTVLTTLRDAGCAGCIIWSGSNIAWNPTAEWWLATEAFVGA